jgi:CDP-glucose 4,6-dehydratase
MEGVVDNKFWEEKRVLITGHSGFKGGWLSLWLQHLGADVTGYSLGALTVPSLFEKARVADGMHSLTGDIRDLGTLSSTFKHCNPEVVFHMAAQSLVGYSYQNPTETYSTNVLGTVNVFEAARSASNVKVIINVTSDKCYENREWLWGYRENDVLGGYDPYSNSKACAELVTSAYRNSFFHPASYDQHGVAIASARAGNVIGGGDWSADRLVPDVINALMSGSEIRIRNPDAIRPWQHVLEPLRGYLLLAERLWDGEEDYPENCNFGPNDQDAKSVSWVVEKLLKMWGNDRTWVNEKKGRYHEAHYLKLDCSKARIKLGWEPQWNLDKALDAVVDWYSAYMNGSDVRTKTIDQIDDYIKTNTRTLFEK